MQIREIMTGGVDAIDPKSVDDAAAEMNGLDIETLERVSDPTPPKTAEPAAQAPPEAAHAQSIDPEGQALATAGLSEPPFAGDPGAPGSGEDKPGTEPQQPQDLLSEIKHVAQRVGGWKQLSEIAEALELEGMS